MIDEFVFEEEWFFVVFVDCFGLVVDLSVILWS